MGTESELADRFGVSRITVRDAIRTLEAQGILTVVLGARGGLRIAEAATDRVSDSLAVQLHLEAVTRAEVTEAMAAIEPTTARRAADQCDADDERRLRMLLAETEAASQDPEAFTAKALDFHLCVAEIARNRALIASVRALRIAEQRHFAPQTTAAVVGRVLDAHRAIAEAVIAHDAETAMREMAAHLEKVAGSRPQAIC